MKINIQFIYFTLIFNLFILQYSSINAQGNTYNTQNIGGSGVDFGRDICIGKNEDFIVSGYTNSSDGDLSVNKGGMDFMVFSTDSVFHLKWMYSYGGSDNDIAFTIKPCKKNGYVIGGFSKSNDLDLPGNKGLADCVLLRIDSTGKMLWMKNYGGSSNDGDIELAIDETDDGGFIVSTNTSSNDVDVSSNRGLLDFWLFKTDSAGSLLWEKTIGGSMNEDAHTVLELSNGDFILAGHTTSSDGDVLKNQGGEDLFIVKTDSTGNVLWSKTYGGSGDDVAYKLIVTDDKGFLACGSTNSSDGDVGFLNGSDDCWIVKLDSSGNMEWEKTFGGGSGDYGMDVLKNDEGYAVAGYSLSNDGDLTSNYGNSDYWLVQIDSAGNLIRQNNFGGSGLDRAMAICSNNKQESILCGFTNSNDIDVAGNNGNMDCWLINTNKQMSVDLKMNIQHDDNSYMCYYDTYTNDITISRDEVTSSSDDIILIFDNSGKLIISKTIRHKLTIKNEDLVNGIYYYQIFASQTKVASGRFLVR